MRVALFDIDGTLADCEHRRHHLTGDEKNWDAFYENMDLDPCIPEIALLAIALDKIGLKIVCCTGRPEKYRERTLAWLKRYDIPVWELYTRNDSDFRADHIVKRELLQTIRAVFEPILVVDDRASVVKMWRDEGLICLQCAEGDF